MAGKPASIDDYLSALAEDRFLALQNLRQNLHALVPGLEETISYSMPAFRHGKQVIAGFLATKAGCSYFPFSGTTLGTLKKELASYSQTKSALHFTPEKPLPKSLLKKLLTARMAECEEKSKKVVAKKTRLLSDEVGKSERDGGGAWGGGDRLLRIRRR